MFRIFPYIILSGIVLFFTFRVAGQMTMPDNVVIGQTRQYFVLPYPGSTYTWWINGEVQTGFTTSEFLHTWNTADTFLLEVQELSQYGCAGPIRSGKVFVSSVPGTLLIIHDAFSPNGDLINDFWNIGNISFYPEMKITIYNRWGQAVWKSGAGYPVPWDGKNNGEELPVDSYHYIIDLHNGTKLIVGTVTIVR
jgi:gliding motility-associated-like protein